MRNPPIVIGASKRITKDATIPWKRRSDTQDMRPERITPIEAPEMRMTALIEESLLTPGRTMTIIKEGNKVLMLNGKASQEMWMFLIPMGEVLEIEKSTALTSIITGIEASAIDTRRRRRGPTTTSLLSSSSDP